MKNDIIKFLCISGIPYKVAPNMVYVTIEDMPTFEYNYKRLTSDFARYDEYKKFIKRCKKLGILRWEDISLMYCLIQLNIPLQIEKLDNGKGKIIFDIYIYYKPENQGYYYRIGQIEASDGSIVFIDSNNIIWDNIESRLDYFRKHGM